MVASGLLRGCFGVASELLRGWSGGAPGLLRGAPGLLRGLLQGCSGDAPGGASGMLRVCCGLLRGCSRVGLGVILYNLTKNMLFTMKTFPMSLKYS